MKLRIGVVLWTAVMCFVPAQPAAAATGRWSVIGRCLNDNGTDLISYGTYGFHYIYPKQSPQDGDWVNSVYAGTYAGSFFEAGWYWTPAEPSPVVFDHHYNARTNTHSEARLSASVPVGSRVGIAITQHLSVSGAWNVYVGGTYVHTWYGTGITSSLPCVGAERYNTADYNKGSWSYVQHFQKVGSSYQWQY